MLECNGFGTASVEGSSAGLQTRDLRNQHTETDGVAYNRGAARLHIDRVSEHCGADEPIILPFRHDCLQETVRFHNRRRQRNRIPGLWWLVGNRNFDLKLTSHWEPNLNE